MKFWQRVLVKTFPVFTGYLVLGMGFGILLEENGFPFWMAPFMSVTMYAGAMQYVGITVLASGMGVLQAALTTLMVNARHLFYGISLLERYGKFGNRKWYLAFTLTDETYSLVCSEKEVPEGIDEKKYFTAISCLNHLYWIFGGIVGYLVGTIITFDTKGIDFSMTALFVTVFVGQWMENKNHFPAITGVMATTVSLLVFGKESFLIPSMIIIAAVLLLTQGRSAKNVDVRKEDEEDASPKKEVSA